MKKFLIPLGLFLGLVVFLAVGLKRDPREIPSPLINKPAPVFSLPTLEGADSFSPEQLRGKVWMFNVWATWCVACREEHPVLVAFARQNAVPIVGLSYKEIQPQDEQGGKLAVLKWPWKLIHLNTGAGQKGENPKAKGKPLEKLLHNLESDIGEEKNLAAEKPEVVADLEKLMNASWRAP